MKRSLLVLFPILLSGCALPPAVMIASYAADGISYIATGKSVSDHGISAVTGRDCEVRHIIKGKAISTDQPAQHTEPRGRQLRPPRQCGTVRERVLRRQGRDRRGQCRWSHHPSCDRGSADQGGSHGIAAAICRARARARLGNRVAASGNVRGPPGSAGARRPSRKIQRTRLSREVRRRFSAYIAMSAWWSRLSSVSLPS